MASSSSGGVPPGFRFHPTDEELLHYYLKRKVSYQKFELDVIREIDLNKIEPWDLQERCKIGSTPQNDWYFFSHKDRKYPTGSRTNRATNAGFWKATGRDKCIRNSFQKIGMRKTLVFYRGRAPHGQKTDWIMHEYRLDDADDPQANPNNFIPGAAHFSDHHAAAPIMVKQLMSDPTRDCESGSDQNLCYQPATAACDSGLEMGQDDHGSSKDTRVGFEDANGSSMNHINPLSLRSEMDFWGYGK
nr:hypothetical protein DCAR_001479 [Ipomoea trifida]